MVSMSTVLVEAKVGSGDCRKNQFFSSLDQSVEQAKRVDLSTKSYFAAQSGEAPEELVVFHKTIDPNPNPNPNWNRKRLRLSKKRKLQAASKINKIFGSKKADRVMPAVHFRDVDGFGFWNRGDVIPSRDGVFCWSVSRFKDDWMREKWLALTQPFAEWCKVNEPDTLIYSGGIALHDNSYYNIRKGDLIFVNLYTCAEAKETHDRSTKHMELIKSFKDHGLEYTYSSKMYGLTLHGFLWRDGDDIEEEQKAEM